VRDPKNLTNVNAPTAVMQMGCWNTYFVFPQYKTLAQRFLFSNDAGAALVMGATTLSSVDSEQLLGEALVPKLTDPSTTVGEAMLSAKRELPADLTDVILGWTLLGDPAAMVQP
jgi:hypothetical protein